MFKMPVFNWASLCANILIPGTGRRRYVDAGVQAELVLAVQVRGGIASSSSLPSTEPAYMV